MAALLCEAAYGAPTSRSWRALKEPITVGHQRHNNVTALRISDAERVEVLLFKIG